MTAERAEAVPPIFIGVDTGRWDKKAEEKRTKLKDAAGKQRSSQPDTPADIKERWERALKCISGIPAWRHNSSSECGPCAALLGSAGSTTACLTASLTVTCSGFRARPMWCTVAFHWKDNFVLQT